MRSEEEIRKELDFLRKRKVELEKKLKRRKNTSMHSPIIDITKIQINTTERKILLLEWVLEERESPDKIDNI